MIIDAALQFANRQALTAGNTVSTDSIDRGPILVGHLIALDHLGLHFNIHQNAGTAQAVLEHSDNNSSFTTLIRTAVFTGTGTKSLELPPLSKRYLRVSFVTSDTATVSAWLGWMK